MNNEEISDQTTSLGFLDRLQSIEISYKENNNLRAKHNLLTNLLAGGYVRGGFSKMGRLVIVNKMITFNWLYKMM